MFDINGDGHMDALETSVFLETTREEDKETNSATNINKKQ